MAPIKSGLSVSADSTIAPGDDAPALPDEGRLPERSGTARNSHLSCRRPKPRFKAKSGSGAARGNRDAMRRYQQYSLCKSDLPVDLPIAAEATPAASEIELALADSVSQFEAGERHGGGDKRLESFQWTVPSFDPPFTRSGRSFHSAERLGTWPSSVTVRGKRSPFESSALRKKACAAAMPQSRRSRKSIVCPCWSTAR